MRSQTTRHLTVAFLLAPIALLLGLRGGGLERTAMPSPLGAAITEEPNADPFARSSISPQREQADEVKAEKQETPNSDDVVRSPSMPPLEPVPQSTPDPVEVQVPPTPIEPAPVAIENMSDRQIEERVLEYEEWLRKGEIGVDLDLSQVSAARLESIAWGFIAGASSDERILIRAGKPSELLRDPVRAKLIGDVSRGKWPPSVALEIERWYLSGHKANLCVCLADRVALEIYRRLAPHLARSSRPNQRYLASLIPSGDGFEVHVRPE